MLRAGTVGLKLVLKKFVTIRNIDCAVTLSCFKKKHESDPPESILKNWQENMHAIRQQLPIPNKQNDVAVFYFPYCFIVCAIVRGLAGARDLSGHVENAAGATRGAQAFESQAHCICYMSRWTILEFLLFFKLSVTFPFLLSVSTRSFCIEFQPLVPTYFVLDAFFTHPICLSVVGKPFYKG